MSCYDNCDKDELMSRVSASSKSNAHVTSIPNIGTDPRSNGLGQFGTRRKSNSGLSHGLQVWFPNEYLIYFVLVRGKHGEIFILSYLISYLKCY